MKSRLAESGAEPVAMSADVFSAFVKSELARWTRVGKERNIKAN